MNVDQENLLKKMAKQREKLLAFFKSWDSNGDGYVSRAEYLKGLPRVTLEIRGAFGKNYYAGNIHGSKHLSYSRQYAKQDRAPLQFVFVNLETRRSDWGKCNILVPVASISAGENSQFSRAPQLPLHVWYR